MPSLAAITQLDVSVEQVRNAARGRGRKNEARWLAVHLCRDVGGYSLSEIVRGFKTFSSRHINELCVTRGRKLWQRNYYEHIIRNEAELDHIRKYIINNPVRWEFDKNNPDCI